MQSCPGLQPFTRKGQQQSRFPFSSPDKMMGEGIWQTELLINCVHSSLHTGDFPCMVVSRRHLWLLHWEGALCDYWNYSVLDLTYLCATCAHVGTCILEVKECSVPCGCWSLGICSVLYNLLIPPLPFHPLISPFPTIPIPLLPHTYHYHC